MPGGTANLRDVHLLRNLQFMPEAAGRNADPIGM